VVKRHSHQDRIFLAGNFVLVTVFFLVSAYPVYFVLCASFSDALAVIRGQVWWRPVQFNIVGYKAVFADQRIIGGYLNSFFYMAAGTSVNVVLTVLAAYPLSRRDFRHRNLIMGLYVFTMLFNGGLIPTYLVVKNLGLIDTRAAMILPNALAVWNMIITRTYFQHNIPRELLEASQMDGCTDFTFLRKVTIPLSGPILAVITLFYAVGHWNSFFDALIYLKSASKFPLQIILRDILIQNQMSGDMATSMQGATDAQGMIIKQQLAELLKYALIVVASLPLLVMYPFVQKYFVRGMLIGSIKG
jgi:multiple sugar transport system permease protein/putative aldouronate transport system permease protein